VRGDDASWSAWYRATCAAVALTRPGGHPPYKGNPEADSVPLLNCEKEQSFAHLCWNQKRARHALRAMFCAPFWSGAAHVVALGPIVVEQHAPQGHSGNSYLVRHRTLPVPDCEAKPPKNLDGFASRAGGWGDSPRHGLSGDGPARVLAFSCQCFAGMRQLPPAQEFIVIEPKGVSARGCAPAVVFDSGLQPVHNGTDARMCAPAFLTRRGD
jgi:hypothetical protein